MRQGAFLDDLVEKLRHFILFSHKIEFDGAFGEVFDVAKDIKACGKLFDGVAKSDALDSALKYSTFSNHLRIVV